MTRTTISLKWLISIWAIFLIILVVSTKLIFGYNDEIIKHILVALHGVLLEILLIVIVLEQVQGKLFQRQVKKVITVIKPKIIGIIESYRFLLVQMIGQDYNSTKLNWDKLAKVDFLKKPNATPWTGNTADYIKWSIERCENKIGILIYKYSNILELELLKDLEILIDHDFSMTLKTLPDLITMNREGYIKHHNEFKAFSLSIDQEKDRMNTSYEEFSIILKDINKYLIKNV